MQNLLVINQNDSKRIIWLKQKIKKDFNIKAKKTHENLKWLVCGLFVLELYDQCLEIAYYLQRNVDPNETNYDIWSNVFDVLVIKEEILHRLDQDNNDLNQFLQENPKSVDLNLRNFSFFHKELKRAKSYIRSLDFINNQHQAYDVAMFFGSMLFIHNAVRIGFTRNFLYAFLSRKINKEMSKAKKMLENYFSTEVV